MKSGKPTYDELKTRLEELELLLGLKRTLKPTASSIFEQPEFAAFINLSRDGKIISNKEGRIISWNKAIELITGINAEMAIGAFIWDVKYQLTPDEEKKVGLAEKMKQDLLFAFNNPESVPDQVHEFSIKTSLGETRILEDHSSMIITVDDVYFLSIIRDISKKKKSDIALKESEERHRGLLNSLELGILVYKPNGDIILANPKACNMFDMLKEEGSGLYRFKVEWEYLDETQKLISDDTCPVRKILRTQLGLRNFLMGSRRKDSDDISWLMVNGYPEFDSNGEVDEVVISLLDISDRRKIVQALHVKNVALDSSILPIGITDLEGKLNYVNPSLVKQWGYENETEMLGVNALEFWNEPLGMKSLIEEAFEKGSATGEFTGIKKDQSLFPASCKVSTIKDEKNQFLGLVGSFEDLSELKKSQETLRESEKKFRSIANYSASWEAWFDVKGKLVWMNTFSEQLTGYTPEEYLAADDFFSMSVYKDDIEKGKAALASALSGSSGSNLEVRCNKKSGGYIWISISWRPIYDNEGNSIGIRTSSKDITDRIQTNYDLVKSKNQYDNLVANIDVGVFILHGKQDACYRFDYVSPKFAEMISTQVESILEDPTMAFRVIHPDDWESFTLKNQESQEQRITLDWEGRIIVNNEIKWMHIVSKPDIQAEGDVLWHGLLIDTTETRKIQEEIALKNTQLLQVISEKDKFFSIIAHDLRNPFNAFLGLTKLMVEDISDLSREEIHEFAVAMSISANNLHKLLENLLEWSRLQRGVTAFDPKKFFVKTQVEETVKQNREAALKKNISVTIMIHEDLCVTADINMFSSTLRNLFSNAIKFTQNGGSIEIKAYQQEKDGIVISIKDNGIGMKPETLNKLFKINEHVNRPGTDGEPSTGLGLILCKDFIEKHGGKIWAESKENSGSTFYFSIPL